MDIEDVPSRIRSQLAKEEQVGGLPYRRLDLAWNEMTRSVVERNLGDFLSKSKDAEALASVVLLSLDDDPAEVRASLRGARNSVAEPPRYWGLCAELVQEARNTLYEEHGLFVTGVVPR